ASIWMPFGRPRLAETAPGIYAPGAYLLVGVAVVVLLTLLQSTLPVAVRRRRGEPRPSRVARVADAVPAPTASLGGRLALEPGRGRDAVPVRSGLAGLTVAVVALVMSLTVSASLRHLLDTPRLYGWGWDSAVDVNPDSPGAGARIEATPGVAAVGYG